MKTEIKTEHTATPWRISGGMVDGYNLVNESDNVTNWNSSYPINKANMEFIVHAVNSHEELLKALILADERLLLWSSFSDKWEKEDDDAMEVIGSAIGNAETKD